MTTSLPFPLGAHAEHCHADLCGVVIELDTPAGRVTLDDGYGALCSVPVADLRPARARSRVRIEAAHLSADERAWVREQAIDCLCETLTADGLPIEPAEVVNLSTDFLITCYADTFGAREALAMFAAARLDCAPRA